MWRRPVLFLLIGIVLISGVAQAEIVGNILTDVKDGPVKMAIVYNLDSHQTVEGIGAAIREDIFNVKNLDYDILIVSANNSTLADDEKVILNQISYNYNFNEKLSAFAGIGIGLSRFEKLESHRFGESDKYASIGVAYQW